MTADDGGGFAKDDVIFYNHFRANFCQFYYLIWIKVNQNLKNISIINVHKRAISELKRIRDRSYLAASFSSFPTRIYCSIIVPSCVHIT